MIEKDPRWDMMFVDKIDDAVLTNPVTTNPLDSPTSHDFTLVQQSVVAQIINVTQPCSFRSITVQARAETDDPDNQGTLFLWINRYLPGVDIIDQYERTDLRVYLSGAYALHSDVFAAAILPVSQIIDTGMYLLVASCSKAFVGLSDVTIAQQTFVRRDVEMGDADFYESTQALIYDIDTNDVGVLETMPIMLAEPGAMGFQINMTSPIAARVTEGDLKESDIGPWTTRSQGDWRGGRGLDVAYTQTNRYHDATADTRFANMAILPPRTVRSKSLLTGPSFIPSDGATRPQAQTVRALFGTRILDVPQFLPSTANVVQSEAMGIDANGKPRKVKAGYEPTEFAHYQPGDKEQQTTNTEKAYLSYTIKDATLSDPIDGVFNTDNQTTSNYLADNGNVLAQGVWRDADTGTDEYSGEARKIRYVSIYIRTVSKGASGKGTVEIRNDGWNPHASSPELGYPGDTVYASGVVNYPNPSTEYAWVSIALDSEVSLEQLTKYWITFKTAGDGAQVYWKAVNKFQRGKTLYSTDQGNSWIDRMVGTARAALSHMYKLSDGKAYTNAVGADLAQSFKVGDSDIHTTFVKLRIRRESWNGNLVAKIKICSDVGSAPGGEIASYDLDGTSLSTAMNWYVFAMPLTLLANTRYWIVLSVAGEKTPWGQDSGTLWWECDTSVKYPDGAGEQRLYAGGAYTAWGENSRDFYFGVENAAIVKRRFTQGFIAGADAVTLTKLQIWAKLDQASDWDPSATLSIRVYADNAGIPSTVALSSGTVARSAVPIGTVGKVVVNMSACALTPGAQYWFSLEPDTTAGNMTLVILNDSNRQYGGGEALLADYVGSWGNWEVGYADIFFIVNDGPVTSGGSLTKTRGAQSFTLSSALTVTKVSLLLSLGSFLGSPTVTASIYSDSSGPNAQLGSVAIPIANIPSIQGWVVATFSAGIALAAGKYWIVLEANSSSVANGIILNWISDANDLNAGDGLLSSYDGASWGDWQAAHDFFYVLNDGQSFPQTITIRPVTFSGDFWLAVGNIIYKFDRTTQEWVLSSNLGVGGDVTALVEHGGKLYVARGDSTEMLVMQIVAGTPNWAVVAGRKYTYLLSYNKYLYGLQAKAGGASLAYFGGSPETWSSNIPFGTSAIEMTGMVGYKEGLLLFSTTGMYELASEYVYQVNDFSQQRSVLNGKNALVWGADGLLYFPIRNSLNSYDGATLTPVGLDQDEGLPAGEQGPVSMMSWTPSWLFAAVDAGTGTSSIYAKVRDGGWHRVARAAVAGKRITVIAIESVTDPNGLPRMWFNQGGEMWYIPMPDLTDNPFTYQGSQYESTAYIISSWFGGELSRVAKDYQEVSLRTSGCSPNQAIDVYIEVDRTGNRWFAGTVTRGPEQVLELRAPVMATKVCASGCTDQIIVIDDDSGLSDMPVGSFIRIKDDVGQVVAKTDNTLTLALPLRNGAPGKGTAIYSSRPVGREIRIILVLRSDDPTKTPRLLSASFQYQELLIDRFRFTMNVRIEDGMSGRGSPAPNYPYDAATTAQKLYQWVRRPTPFVIVDPRGNNWRVKVLNAGETNFTRETGAEKPGRVKSTMQISAVEV